MPRRCISTMPTTPIADDGREREQAARGDEQFQRDPRVGHGDPEEAAGVQPQRVVAGEALAVHGVVVGHRPERAERPLVVGQRREHAGDHARGVDAGPARERRERRGRAPAGAGRRRPRGRRPASATGYSTTTTRPDSRPAPEDDREARRALALAPQQREDGERHERREHVPEEVHRERHDDRRGAERERGRGAEPGSPAVREPADQQQQRAASGARSRAGRAPRSSGPGRRAAP